MLDATYPPPVAALLTVGSSLEAKPQPRTGPMPTFEEMRAETETRQNRKREPTPLQSAGWPDYRQFGLGPDHVPDLLAMMQDDSLIYAEEESPESWAPLHAWRAIGQLGATEAIEPLIALLDTWEDWDIFNEEIADVFGLIGSAAIPALVAFLGEQSHPLYARTTASNALERIARIHPEARDAAVAALVAQLEQFAKNDESLNAFLISDLMDLEATEALPVIERAYAADRVDVSILGDWEEAQIAFGVKAARDTPRLNWFEEENRRIEQRAAAAAESAAEARRRTGEKKIKSRKKMADKSRRQNRKRK